MTQDVDAALARLAQAVAPRLEVAYSTPFGLLTTLLLAVQASEARAATVAPELLSKYPDPAALASADENAITAIIKSLPLSNRKASTLRQLSEVIVRCHGGEVPTAFAALLTLPGVGPKTAGIVAGEAGDSSTFPIERHAVRVINRLGFDEDELAEQIPKSDRYSTALRLTLHGRHCCTAQRPRCSRCPLEPVCPSAVGP